MAHYEAYVYGSNVNEPYAILTQDRPYLDKKFIQNCRITADMNTSGPEPWIWFLIWRDGNPVVAGSVYSWEEQYDGTKIKARYWLSRWGKDAGEYERCYTLAE